MKRFIIILSALAAAGCTMNRQNLYDPEVGMSFQPAMLMHVAEDDAERYPADQSFGVSAWSLPDEKQWNGNSADATLYIDALEAKPLDELNWCCDEKLVWPSVLENLTFMSWSPYSAGQQCDNEDGVRFEINDILTEQTDILYTDPLQDICKIECGGVVTIPFRHALCQMSICVKNRVFETEKIIVKDVVMDRIAGSGNFSSLRDPQWQTGGEDVSVTFLDEPFLTGAHPEPAGKKWLLIPQEINTPFTVEFSFTVETGETITQRLKTIPLKMRLEAGKSYTMTLSIGIDDVKFLKEIIKDRFEK